MTTGLDRKAMHEVEGRTISHYIRLAVNLKLQAEKDKSK